MIRFRKPSILSLMSLALVAAACDGAGEDLPGEKVSDTEVVYGALTDSFSTPSLTSLGTAGGTDRFLNVWTGRGALGDVIAGQVFNASGAVLSPSRAYVDSAHMKIGAGVSFDPVSKRFLIVWEDTYSSTDRDILGIITDENGVPLTTGTLHIDFSTSNDTQPSVTFVGGAINKWLVVFDRGAGHLVHGKYVDSTGAVGLAVDMTTTPVNGIMAPQARYVASTNRIAVTYGRPDNVYLAFASPSTLALGATTLLPTIAGHHFGGHRMVVNPNNNTLAVAFDDSTSSSDSIRLKLVPSGCESFSCALTEQTTTFATSASITNLGSPGIGALGQWFVMYAVQYGPALPNGVSIKFAQVNAVGVVGTKNEATIPSCAARTILDGTGPAVGSFVSPTRINMIFDSLCSTRGAVEGQQMSTTFARVDYRVSDPAK